jgi:hypothetical protein
MAKARPWSKGEIATLTKAIKSNTDNNSIYLLFPYRSQSSVRHKIGETKTTLLQNEVQKEVLEEWVKELREAGPKPIQRKVPLSSQESIPKRELEVCIMDPHFGMQCYAEESDHPWSMELAKETCHWAIHELLELARPFGPYERIVFPFGNDYLHADNIYHTTTKGTNQPEMLSWHEVYKQGKNLAIEMVSTLREVAPVKIYQIPGNHSTHSDYTIGLILDAYFHNDQSVEIDCSSSPYKFHRFGCNLIGYEHGHSVPAVRLAALMANMVPKDWAETSYREYHLGDQHRKATSKPSSFEEQGVSIEYLAGLTPPNAWHKTHSYNFQKRGAVAFVWDSQRGQLAKLCVNLDNYTGKPMK